MPTEAQWEFAARGGNNSLGFIYSGSNTADDVAIHSGISGNSPISIKDGRGTFPVGSKSPNELGIYDMSGNAWEWCNDWYDVNYYSISPLNDPQGPNSSTKKIMRGGGFWFNSNSCIVSFRSHNFSTNESELDFGFRVVFN